MTSAPKESSPFLRALNDLLSGARHAHELAEVLVTEAVQLTLARISKDYPLDFTKMQAKYQGDVVAQCCRLVAAPEQHEMCGAPTKTGKACGRRAVVGGACSLHIEAWKEQQAAQRRKDMYAVGVKRDAPGDAYAQELQLVSAKRRVPMVIEDQCDLVARSF